MSEFLLEARGVTKHFGGVAALLDGAFSLRAGEIHAIMGENGAGKSTLGKILAGVYPPDAGSITLDGELFCPANPREAQARGVAMIYQELDLFPHLSIAENMVTANLAFNENVWVKRGEMEAFAQPFVRRVGLNAPLHTLVGELSIGDQQLVAIARALSMNAQVMVMDESTSALTEHAVDNLFNVIRELKSLGVAIIYVSHKMDEIFSICDRVTILRDGVTVGSYSTLDVGMEELIQCMVGREIDTDVQSISHRLDEVILSFEDVCTSKLRDVSFHLNKGEVLGVAGLVGSGRTELGEALFGLDVIESGLMTFRGIPYHPASPVNAMEQGIGFVPEDRKTMGLMMQMSVRENGMLSGLVRGGVVQHREEADRDNVLAQRTRLKSANPRASVSCLSGGNQQKVLLGRWLSVDPEVYFLDDPTRGVDVGAKQDIYTLIDTMAAEGKSLIMVSSELPELLRCCDRILIMNSGRIVGEVDARNTGQEAIMHLATAAGDLE